MWVFTSHQLITPNPISMTIQENHRVMKEQLLSQAQKCRDKYQTLSRKKYNPFEEQLKTELLTRAKIFERVAHNLLIV